MRHVTLITTGGTIEKTYDERSGELSNRGSIVRRMLRRLRVEDTAIRIVEVMSKDSLFMTEDDRAMIASAVEREQGITNGIVILHGTDTLSVTGELLHQKFAAGGGSALRVPIVLTGAMRPYEMKRSDALQNLTESIFAAGVLPPAVYCVMHGRTHPFPGVVKDRERGTFCRQA